MKARILAPLFLLPVALTACGGDTAVIETVDAGVASNLIASPDTVLLDIRTPEEFSEERIEGSVNIDFYAADFADQIGSLDRDTAYVVYCRTGNRSGQAMELFRDLEFTEVHEIGGGIVAWLQAGLATVSG
jgi:rhodanese-related sulfurtransferase